MFYNKFKNDPVAEAVKKIMEAEQVDEAFPTVADAKKRMDAAEKSKFEKKKISTGTVYQRKHNAPKDDEKDDKENVKEELKGNQHKIDANKNNKIDAQDFEILRKKKEMKKETYGEEVEQIDELSKDTLSSYLQKRGSMVSPRSKNNKGNENMAKAVNKMANKKTNEEVEQIDELSKKTLGSYIKKANARQTDDYHDAGSMDVEPERRDGIARTQKINRAVDKLISKKTNEDVEQVDEVSPPGFKGTVKAMKKHKEIDNPFALAWYMKKKGYKSHKKADGTMKKEEVDSDTRTKDMISGPNKPTKQKDDVGPGADGKSTKVKFRGGPMGGD